MFKFYIPLQKSLDLQPYTNYPVPVVRVFVHTDELLKTDQLAEVERRAQKIVDRNRAEIQHWCNARRQEYSLSQNSVDKKTYILDQLTLTHTILFNQEIIELNVYPKGEKQGFSEDCLMIVQNNKIWAFPMAQINALTTLKPIYQKTLENTELNPDPDPYNRHRYFYRQYKFVGAQVSFVIADVEFLSDRIVPRYNQYRISPVSKNFSYSFPVEFNDNGPVRGGVINGSGQTIQLAYNEYKYGEDTVEVTYNRPVPPTYTPPYAVDSAGTTYFGGTAGDVTGDRDFDYLFNVKPGVHAYLNNSTNSFVFGPNFTPAMRTAYFEKLNLYGPYYPASDKNVLFGAAYGTRPGDTLYSAFSYDLGYTGVNVPSPPPAVPYRVDAPAAAPPITNVSLSIPYPVFSTGNGDRIEMQPYTFSSYVITEWYWYIFGPSVNAYTISFARDTTASISFANTSFSAVDIGRVEDTWYEFGAYSPQVSMDVHTNMPAPGGLFYDDYKFSKNYYNENVGKNVNADIFSSTVYHPVAGAITGSSDSPVSSRAIGHVSNGKSYIQAFYVYSGNQESKRVYCNGVDIYSQLAALGITEWDLMVMDVKLDRIKKFT